MKKKGMALVFLAVAAVCVWLALHATQNAALAWAGVVVFVVFAALIWKGRGPRPAAKEEQKPTKSIPQEIVFTTKDGKAYHRYDTCAHVFGRDRIKMTKAEAKQRGLHPCKSCFPYGD